MHDFFVSNPIAGIPKFPGLNPGENPENFDQKIWSKSFDSKGF